MPRVGIIGRGWGERSQAPNFRDAELEVVAVVGRDGWRELVARKDIDLISVAMPPALHVEIATAALDAGKHVVCEKPAALDAAEAAKLVAAAAAHPNQIAIIDHELRFLPSFRTARERIAHIGAIRYVEVHYASPSRGDRSRAWNWWSDASQGGGVWGAVGSHFVDALRYLGCEIEAAQAMLSTIIGERSGKQVTSDDFAAVQLKLAAPASPASNGAPPSAGSNPPPSGAPPSAGSTPQPPAAPASAGSTLPPPGAPALAGHGEDRLNPLLHSSLAAMTFSAVATGPDEPTTFTIHGELGSFRLTGEELLFAKPKGAFERIAGGELSKRPGNSPGGAFGTGTYHLGLALYRALDDDDRTALAHAATFADGLAQQRVLDAARRSDREGGRWVELS